MIRCGCCLTCISYKSMIRCGCCLTCISYCCAVISDTLWMLCCQNADYMTAQVFDLTDKLEQSEAHLGRSGFVMGMDAAESSEDRLTKATKDRSALQFSHQYSYYLKLLLGAMLQCSCGLCGWPLHTGICQIHQNNETVFLHVI